MECWVRKSRLDLMNDMLLIARNGVHKTRIMYFANTNYEQLGKYLTVLQSKALLERKGDCYLTTQKGQAFLSAYATLQKVMGETPRPFSRHAMLSEVMV